MEWEALTRERTLGYDAPRQKLILEVHQMISGDDAMDLYLKDKVALVTGAGSGIGRTTALCLAEEGARVCCADLFEGKAVETAGDISERGGQAMSVAWISGTVGSVIAVVKPRVFEVGIKMLTARALYDAEHVAIQLTWRDASRNVQIGSADTFRDAVAIEFPSDPSAGIPYFAMGEPDKPVVIYQWKAE